MIAMMIFQLQFEYFIIISYTKASSFFLLLFHSSNNHIKHGMLDNNNTFVHYIFIGSVLLFTVFMEYQRIQERQTFNLKAVLSGDHSIVQLSLVLISIIFFKTQGNNETHSNFLYGPISFFLLCFSPFISRYFALKCGRRERNLFHEQNSN